MDLDRNGKLSKAEVKAGFLQAFGTFISDQEIDEMFGRIDCDGTGELEFSEFVMAALGQSHLLDMSRLRKVFAWFDKDGSGSVTKSELQEIFAVFHAAGLEVDNIISEVDYNSNGEIEFDEFYRAMVAGVH